MTLLTLLAAVLAVAGLACLGIGALALRRRRLFGAGVSAVFGLLLLALGALCVTLAIGTQGYRAFTREEVVVVVQTRPTGRQTFNATFTFPDGRDATFSLAGDELYVDAHILKWKPIANLLGLHTAYELDRVAGRYAKLEDELQKPRTVFSLAREKPVDVFDLRRRVPLLAPLVDTEYGSATFVLANRPATFEIRVSTTGLLVRPASGSARS